MEEPVMYRGRYLFYFIALIISAITISTDYSVADVLCRNNKRGVLKLRPDECKKNETQVDLSDIATDPKLDAKRWIWLGEGEGTYWYVPAIYLPAVEWDSTDPRNYSPVLDQTVWHIERYENGYFFGPIVVQIGLRPPLCQYMIGSVTPDGRVYIAFNPLTTFPIGNPSLTIGLGHMILKNGDWTFNMQMSSGVASNQVAHWAFMLECKPGEECWEDLPGVQKSLPEFFSNCEDES
jgi:hypothetical protein